MKNLILASLLFILSVSVAFAEEDLKNQVMENQTRIEQLEGEIDALQETLEYLESRMNSGDSGQMSVDPIIGTWNCTNSLYTYEIIFDVDGNLVQQGNVLGNARTTTWSRAGNSQILIGHAGADERSQASRLRPEFQSQDEFTVQVIESGTLWRCERISQ